jgi:2-polyprenyl-3-methyl-5-hydroxy-6-metoxy-1,4-benzoquinol methylase
MTDQTAGQSDQVRRLFDTKAPSWQAKYAPDGALTGRLDAMSAEVRLHASPGSAVLDIGCGTGELARELAIRGYRVTGADISAEMLDRARTAAGDGELNWVQLDSRWRALPLAAEAFDTVVAASVLEYVDLPGVVLSECGRVLAPGGVVLLTVPDVRHPVRWLEWAASQAARLPLERSILAAVPRLAGYLAYLRMSRHRYRLAWWEAAARQAGLLAVPASAPAPTPGGARWPRTLRLLTLRRAADETGAT